MIKMEAQRAILDRHRLNDYVFFAYWKSDKYGFPANGGTSARLAHPGMIEEVIGPLKICTQNALHATMQPESWKGERIWLVAMYGELFFEDDVIGALKREIICELSSGAA